MRKWLTVLLTMALLPGLLSGCSAAKKEQAKNPEAGSENGGNAGVVDVDFSATDEDMFSNRDSKTEYDDKEAVLIKLNGSTAQAGSKSVKISGSTVTITEEATYVISGTLDDGMLVVNAPDTAKLQLVFDGVSITCQTSAALYIVEADKVFVTLADGTENSLANGGSFTAVDDNNIDGAVFSKQDLTFNGSGKLTVTSPAGHGIVCKDDLVITSGSYTVNSASHGLDANDSVRVGNATLTIDAGKDAIHAENDEDAEKGFVYISGGTIEAEAEGDGISAGAYLQIEDGTIDLLIGGGSENGTKEHSDGFGNFMGGGGGGGYRPGRRSANVQTTAATTDSTSMKGLKAESGLLISKGTITINSADDAIHSNTSLVINGGIFTLASGDDAVHAEDTLTITGGEMDISESYEGLEALHIDLRGGTVKLKAGDDGLNAAGGTDQSGMGGRDEMYGRYGGGPGGGGPGGGGPGGMSANSNGSIKISGGTLFVQASGDGIDANGTLEITGGHVTVVGPTQGDTSILDYDKSAVISGGTFIGTGSTVMAQGLSSTEQGVVIVNVRNTANTSIVLKDAEGNTILSHTPELEFARVVLSCPELVKGETYTLTIGNQTDEVTAS